jgi:hypothetical protein
MKLQLPDDIISPQDLKSLTLEIRQYAGWYSQYSVKSRVTNAKPSPPPSASVVATSLIKNWANNQPSQKGLDDLISSLEALEADSPRVTITLAAAAPGSLKKTLVEWCRANVGDSILVTFKFNSTILGGLVVQHGSHVYDWSFRRQILAASQNFPEVLRRV